MVWPVRGWTWLLQIFGHGGELLQRGLQIMLDFLGNDLGRGKIRGVVQSFVLQPQDVDFRLSGGNFFNSFTAASRSITTRDGSASCAR